MMQSMIHMKSINDAIYEFDAIDVIVDVMIL